jgi:hypothetical protein
VAAHQPVRHLAGADHQQRLDVGPRQVLGAERRVRRGLPMGDLGGVHHRERPAVIAVEQHADRLHRRQLAVGKVAREAGVQLGHHEATGIDRAAGHQLLALVVAEIAVMHRNLRPPVRGLDRLDQDRKAQDAVDLAVVDNMHVSLLHSALALSGARRTPSIWPALDSAWGRAVNMHRRVALAILCT